MTSPMPDLSQDWGVPRTELLDVSGLDIGKASAPADPMHFLPNTGAPISGSPDPLSGPAGDASWGYPHP